MGGGVLAGVIATMAALMVVAVVWASGMTPARREWCRPGPMDEALSGDDPDALMTSRAGPPSRSDAVRDGNAAFSAVTSVGVYVDVAVVPSVTVAPDEPVPLVWCPESGAERRVGGTGHGEGLISLRVPDDETRKIPALYATTTLPPVPAASEGGPPASPRKNPTNRSLPFLAIS